MTTKDLPDTKKRIIISALDLFSSKGFASTTTREIAAAAGVNELTLFRNFGSKDGLLESAIESTLNVEGIASDIPPISGDPEEDLFILVEFLRENIRKRRNLYRLMFRDYSNPIVERNLKEVPGRIKKLLVGRVKQILRPNVKGDLDYETASIFLMSYFFRSEMQTAMMGIDPFHEIDERRTREVIRIFLKGVLPREGSD
jgi:AcrR family transcriptional regulator